MITYTAGAIIAGAIIRAAMITCFSIVGIAALYYGGSMVVDEYQALSTEGVKIKFKFNCLLTTLGLIVAFIILTQVQYHTDTSVLHQIHNWLNRY